MPSRTRATRATCAAVLHVLAPTTAAAMLCAGVGLSSTPVAALPVGVPAAQGSDWSAAPASGGGSGERPYFYLEGRPGAVLEDTVVVTNPGDRPRTVRLRGADAYNTSGGAFAVRAPGRSTGTGTWIAFADTEVEVPARTRAEVPFTVTVPQDAVPGDHPGAVVVSGDGREAGVRVHLRVNGPTLSALSVEDVSVVETGEGAGIRYALVNRGNTALRPRLAVRGDGLFGEVLRREARALPLELLPGQRVRLTEPWRDPPALDAAEVTLTATAEHGARASATASYAAFPCVAALSLLLVATGAGASVHALRRRGRVNREGEDPAERSAQVQGSRGQLTESASGAAR
ncbi:WxL protein peptidoglycan domain-containing protein [Streptomyces pathocidini]|uniref:WxL protein peptidoglycan domain-containing protein n=1 Tax=Streptomyces pathocidini TaxID=1650571 RepID=A0ABW7UWQ1_9ACTN|nr:DUF916 domain-containing protein [Streptomyces pathocidini]